MSVGGFGEIAPAWMSPGLADLRSRRDGSGRWRTYPFYYTLLSLVEIDHPAAQAELTYAAPACERVLRRRPGSGEFEQRRAALARQVLEAYG